MFFFCRYYRANSVRYVTSPCEGVCALNHYCAITRVDYREFRQCLETAASALASSGNHCKWTTKQLTLILSLVTVFKCYHRKLLLKWLQFIFNIGSIVLCKIFCNSFSNRFSHLINDCLIRFFAIFLFFQHQFVSTEYAKLKWHGIPINRLHKYLNLILFIVNSNYGGQFCVQIIARTFNEIATMCKLKLVKSDQQKCQNNNLTQLGRCCSQGVHLNSNIGQLCDECWKITGRTKMKRSRKYEELIKQEKEDINIEWVIIFFCVLTFF